MKPLLIACLLMSSIAWSARSEPLRITVYDQANLPSQVLRTVSENLLFLLRHSGIEMQWAAGAPDADEATLITQTNIVSAQQQRRISCYARRDIAVRILPQAPSGVP